MENKKNPSNDRGYRVVQNEGQITWRIEELWDGGVVRGPFGTKEYAIRREEEIARAEGFIDDLVLKETVKKEEPHKDAFKKDSDGKWHCIQACSIEMGNKEIVFSKGMTFTTGIPYLGIDIAEWLDEND
ncbi:hypothetical protein ACFLT4_02910 [Chloroflexota bacterium]